jgi:beta-glucanase (GH16 family)
MYYNFDFKNKITVMNKIIAFILCIAFVLSCEKNGNDTPASDLPKITIQAGVIPEGNAKNTFAFKLTLDKATDKIVTVNYTTEDKIAIAGSDYEAKTGVLTFPANTTEGEIAITILGDSLKEADENFGILLSNPVNATLVYAATSCIITNDDQIFNANSDEGYRTPETYTGYTLEWSDEFNAAKLNTDNWIYNTGGNGWGNKELQNYTNSESNTYMSNGKLVIEARAENLGANNYTSARLSTSGKKTFTFGRIDIRARPPIGQGIWPALWLLGNNIGSNPWPLCGEIDIMEIIGKQPKTVFGTAHWRNSAGVDISRGGNTAIGNGTMGDQYHVYSIVWDTNGITWFFDDVQYHQVLRPSVGATVYPFDKPFFMLINVAVGGVWPGNPDATTTFPQRLFVDYVRVFKKN